MRGSNTKKSLRGRYYLSEEGMSTLQARIIELEQRRAESIERLKMLKEQQSDGVSLEDSSYIQTLSTIQFIEAEAEKTRYVLSNATIIQGKANAHKVSIGSRVRLEGSGQQLEYTIVNSVEADPFNGKISDESPLGKQLLGKKLQESVIVGSTKNPLRLKLVHIGG